MKKILCDSTSCIHNEIITINSTQCLVCKRCATMIINTYDDTCEGYESVENYLERIGE